MLKHVIGEEQVNNYLVINQHIAYSEEFNINI